MRERAGPRLREFRLLTPSGRGVGEFTQLRAHFSRASLGVHLSKFGKRVFMTKITLRYEKSLHYKHFVS